MPCRLIAAAKPGSRIVIAPGKYRPGVSASNLRGTPEAPGTGFMLQNRGGLFSLEKGQPNTLEPHKRPLHTIIPGFMEKDGVRIGFGIMGGWNQAQAHAQFIANIADYGMTIQQALEAGSSGAATRAAEIGPPPTTSTGLPARSIACNGVMRSTHPSWSAGRRTRRRRRNGVPSHRY